MHLLPIALVQKMGSEEELNGAALPPPPPVIPLGITPVKESELDIPKSSQGPKRLPMVRCGLGSKGQKIQLITNHFQVKMPNSDGHFYQYSVCLLYIFTISDDGNGDGWD